MTFFFSKQFVPLAKFSTTITLVFRSNNKRSFYSYIPFFIIFYLFILFFVSIFITAVFLFFLRLPFLNFLNVDLFSCFAVNINQWLVNSHFCFFVHVCVGDKNSGVRLQITHGISLFFFFYCCQNTLVYVIKIKYTFCGASAGVYEKETKKKITWDSMQTIGYSVHLSELGCCASQKKKSTF